MKTKRFLLLIALVLAMILPAYDSACAVSKARPASSISSYDEDNPQNLTASNLFAETAVLIDGKTGRVLFEKDKDKLMYPASTTKIMTALLVLENCNPKDKTTCSLNSTRSEATWIPVMYGEEYTIDQLLHALLMISANDAAIVLAEEIAGSVEAFADMMNARAKQLGCINTNFRNANGLPNGDHYTTAHDMALIAAEAMKNETFREIITTSNYTLPPSNKRENSVKLDNKNKFLSTSGDKSFSYEYGAGIKTGYTNAAQSTFVAAAEKDGMLLISVVFGSTAEGKWLDSQKLMDYGFSLNKPIDIVSLYNSKPHKVLVMGAMESDTIDGMIELIIDPDDEKLLEGYFDTKEKVRELEAAYQNYIAIADISSISAPVKAGEVLATMTFQAPFMPEAVQVDLVAQADVAKKPIPTNAPVLTPNPDGTDSTGVLLFTTAPTTSNKMKLL